MQYLVFIYIYNLCLNLLYFFLMKYNKICLNYINVLYVSQIYSTSLISTNYNYLLRIKALSFRSLRCGSSCSGWTINTNHIVIFYSYLHLLLNLLILDCFDQTIIIIYEDCQRCNMNTQCKCPSEQSIFQMYKPHLHNEMNYL